MLARRSAGATPIGFSGAHGVAALGNAPAPVPGAAPSRQGTSAARPSWRLGSSRDAPLPKWARTQLHSAEGAGTAYTRPGQEALHGARQAVLRRGEDGPAMMVALVWGAGRSRNALAAPACRQADPSSRSSRQLFAMPFASDVAIPWISDRWRVYPGRHAAFAEPARQEGRRPGGSCCGGTFAGFARRTDNGACSIFSQAFSIY